MLHDVPHRDHIKRLVVEVDRFKGAMPHVQPLLAGPLNRVARRLDTLDVPAALARDLQEHAEMAANVEDAAGALMLLDGSEIAGERLDAPAPLLFVPLIDHPVIRVDD